MPSISAPESDCIITSAGIDYLTLTTTANATKRRMLEYFMGIAAEDRALGYKPSAGGAFGFFGEKTRHALHAHKEDRTLLRVSGRRAQRVLTMCREGDNCTRLDVQITIRVPGGDVKGFLAYQRDLARMAPAVRGHRPEVKSVETEKGPETVYIGSRSSDVFIRLYDKFEECGEEWARGCVRLEVELKGKTSKALWAHCAESGDGTLYLLRVLLGYLKRRGVDTSMIFLEAQDIAPASNEPLRDSVSLAWLATQVAPTVARLSQGMGWQTPLRVLFSQAMSEADFTTIMNAFSIRWGC